MTSTAIDIPAKGKITQQNDDIVVFEPANTNYQLHLRSGSSFSGSIGQPIDCVIRLIARKVYTVPSGGNFIQPIFGSPRIIQGRVRSLDEKHLVVHAGLPISVVLPTDAHAIDLNRGPITQGCLVNVVAMPGATIEPRL